MAKDIVQQSPFDSIRKVDAAGVESWSATELLSMLGYKSWKRIKDTTERAKVAALNSGAVVDLHFVKQWEVIKVGGNPNTLRRVHKDYCLSETGVQFILRNMDLKKTTANRAEKTEKQYQTDLCKKLKGIAEVLTPVGSIDILTKTEIIEVKGVKKWKHAIGQIMSYSYYYPLHIKRIHLFGVTSTAYLQEVIKICDSLNIVVSVET